MIQTFMFLGVPCGPRGIKLRARIPAGWIVVDVRFMAFGISLLLKKEG